MEIHLLQTPKYLAQLDLPGRCDLVSVSENSQKVFKPEKYSLSVSYKLTPCVYPSCKVFNVLTSKIVKNRISDDDHCAHKIDFGAEMLRDT